MSRAFNFSAGPATLPQTVLEQAQAEMLDWHGVGAGCSRPCTRPGPTCGR